MDQCQWYTTKKGGFSLGCYHIYLYLSKLFMLFWLPYHPSIHTVTMSVMWSVQLFHVQVKSCTTISAMRRLDLMAPKRQRGWSVTRSLKATVPLVSGLGLLNCIIKTTVNWDFSHFCSNSSKETGFWQFHILLHFGCSHCSLNTSSIQSLQCTKC